MIITFSNRKSRVGKSSLCLALANYWSSRGIPVKVVDVDPQESLYNTRKNDLKLYDLLPKYDVLKYDMEKMDGFGDFIKGLKKENSYILFDSPSGVNGDIFMHLIKISDYVLVPFQYETYSIDITGRYSRALKILEDTFPEQHRTVVYIPNMIYPKDIDCLANYWSKYSDCFCGLKAPLITLQECMRERNSFFMAPDVLDCVSPCFEYLTQVIIKNDMSKI